jgi:isoleucyl-tRNA synthetase
MMDRIVISIEADAEVAKAAAMHADYIKSETLADDIVSASGLEKFDINGHETGLAVRKN